jgi:Glu-tRNA(Gln) amidotransferase subunit E-like FAD-binding protein
MQDKKIKPSPNILKPEDIKFYYDKAQDMLSKYEHVKTAEWVQQLVETCLAEREFDSGLTYFIQFIRENGLEIEVDQEVIEKLMRKLFEIRFARKMIHASGLSSFEDRIINHLIDTKFIPGLPSPPTPSRPKPI